MLPKLKSYRGMITGEIEYTAEEVQWGDRWIDAEVTIEYQGTPGDSGNGYDEPPSGADVDYAVKSIDRITVTNEDGHTVEDFTITPECEKEIKDLLDKEFEGEYHQNRIVELCSENAAD